MRKHAWLVLALVLAAALMLLPFIVRGQGGETGGGGGPGTGGGGNLSTIIDDSGCEGGNLVLRNAGDTLFDCLADTGVGGLCLVSQPGTAEPIWAVCPGGGGGGATDFTQIEPSVTAGNQVIISTSATDSLWKTVPPCNGTGDALGYDDTNKIFTCLVDDGAGGGMTSWLLEGDDTAVDVTITNGNLLQVIGGVGITTEDGDAGADSLTINCDNATTSTTGCASFNSSRFTVSSGAVDINTVTDGQVPDTITVNNATTATTANGLAANAIDQTTDFSAALCGVDGRILERTGGVWACVPTPTGGGPNAVLNNQANTFSTGPQTIDNANSLCLQDGLGTDEFCLRSATTAPTGTTTLALNINPANCETDANNGTLTVDNDVSPPQIVCEPDDGGSGGGISTVEDVDAVPTFGSLTKLTFDQADGFGLSSPGAGTVRVDLAVPRLMINASADLALPTGTTLVGTSGLEGADIKQAITNCGSAPCQIQLEAGTYADVCVGFFSKNYVRMIGKGQGTTILQAHQNMDTCYNDSQGGGDGDGGNGAVVFFSAGSNVELGWFTIDGDKDHTIEPTTCNTVTHGCGYGVWFNDPSANNFYTRTVYLHDLEIKDMVGEGVETNESESILMERLRVADVGCHQVDTPCGCAATAPGSPGADCRGWNLLGDVAVTGVAGRKNNAIGINISSSNVVLRNSVIDRSVKHAVSTGGASAETAADSPSKNVIIEQNEIYRGADGLVLNAGTNVVVRQNVISNNSQSGGDGVEDIGLGILVAANTARDVLIEDNLIENNQHAGIRVWAINGTNQLTIRNNFLKNNCATTTLADNRQGTIGIVSNFGGAGNGQGLILEGNQIVSNPLCSYALFLDGALGSGSVQAPVFVRGGLYTAGSLGSVLLDFPNLTVEGLDVTGNLVYGANATGTAFKNYVSGTTTVNAAANVLDLSLPSYNVLGAKPVTIGGSNATSLSLQTSPSTLVLTGTSFSSNADFDIRLDEDDAGEATTGTFNIINGGSPNATMFSAQEASGGAGPYINVIGVKPYILFDDSDSSVGGQEASIVGFCAAEDNCGLSFGAQAGGSRFSQLTIFSESNASTVYLGGNDAEGNKPTNAVKVAQGGVMTRHGTGSIEANRISSGAALPTSPAPVVGDIFALTGATSGTCTTGGSAVTLCRVQSIGPTVWAPAGDGGSGGGGGIATVGNCTPGAGGTCFGAGGTGTGTVLTFTGIGSTVNLLSSNANLTIGIDEDQFLGTPDNAILRFSGNNDATLMTLDEAGILTPTAGAVQAPGGGASTVTTGRVRLGNTTTESICWEGAAAATDVCLNVGADDAVLWNNASSLTAPSGTGPTTATVGQIAFDTNHFGTRGAIQVRDLTAGSNTFVVATEDVPADNQIPQFDDATDTVKWEDPPTGGGGVSTVGDGTTSIGSSTSLSFTAADGFDVTGTSPAPVVNLNAFTATTKGAVPLSGGGTVNFLRADGGWQPPPGNVTSVGNCAPGACFTGANGTTLESNTDILLDLDKDNNEIRSLQVRTGVDGSETIVFQIWEIGHFYFRGIAPQLFFDDTTDVNGGAADEVNEVSFVADCLGSFDCNWQILAQSGETARTGMLTMFSNATAPLLYLGGAGEGVLPNHAITVNETGGLSTSGANSRIYNAVLEDSTSAATNPADTGALRLDNNASAECWEDAAGSVGVVNDFCLKGDASNQVTTTGTGAAGLFDLTRVGNATQGKFSSDGTDWFWDQLVGGTLGSYDNGEIWIFGKGCVSSSSTGAVACEDDVHVDGNITESGITKMHERKLYDFSTAAQSIPGPDDCWALHGDFNAVIPANAADPGGRCRQRLAYDVHVTRICATIVDGSLPASGNCKVDFYSAGSRATPLATIDVATGTAGDLDSFNEAFCADVGIDVNASTWDNPNALYAQARAGAECDAATNWPEIYFEILGYGVDLP